MRTRVFRPLGLRKTGFGWARGDQPWGHSEGAKGSLAPVSPRMADRLPPALAPTADVHVSARDLAQIARARLLGLRGRPSILQVASFRKLHESQIAIPHPTVGDLSYAMGWQVRPGRDEPDRAVSSHTGDLGTFMALVRVSPGKNRAYVILSNGYSAAGKALLPAALRRL